MSANVVIYVKPTCPYCIRAKQLLDSKGVQYQEHNVNTMPQEYAELQKRTNQYTVPQIFIGEKFIGGCDDLFALERAGQLDPLLKA